MINMIFITALVRVVLRPEGADVRRMILLGLIKFPLLYVAGYFLLSYPAFVAMYTVIGSGAVFAILLLKALGRMITGLDESGKDKANLRGVL